jgi:hypothetical protein
LKLAEEILSEFHIEMLSLNAVKMYVAIWNYMASRNVTCVSMDDAEASRRSRVLLQHITAAQSELASANLMLLIPGERQTRYTFVADPDDPDSVGAEA